MRKIFSKFRVRFLTLSILMGLPFNATGLSADDGTFKTVTVQSPEACAELCKAAELCRGHTTLQTLINGVLQSDMECRLNNGLGDDSPFKFPTPPPLDLTQAIVDLNAYRTMHNLPSVTLNQKLVLASDIHAKDLARTGTISHTGSDGSSPFERIERQGYAFSLAAENVATGQKDWPEVFKAWQNSPGHNENLLLPGATEFGAALIFDPKSTFATYWAMLVAAPL